MLVNYCEDCVFVDQRDVTLDEIKRGNGSLDLRLNVYSVNNMGTMTTYKNYIQTMKVLMNMKSKIFRQYLLDLGYVPLMMPPLFYREWCEMYLPKVKIPYKLIQATSFVDRSFSGEFNDIWVHKLDAAEFLNCKPTAVTVEKMIDGGII